MYFFETLNTPPLMQNELTCTYVYAKFQPKSNKRKMQDNVLWPKYQRTSLYYPRSINYNYHKILYSSWNINLCLSNKCWICVTVIRSSICKNMLDQTNIYLIWFLFLWNYNDLFTGLRPALLKFSLTKKNLPVMSDGNAHFGKTGLHCAKFTKLLREPPFNIKEVSNGVFFLVQTVW